MPTLMQVVVLGATTLLAAGCTVLGAADPSACVAVANDANAPDPDGHLGMGKTLVQAEASALVLCLAATGDDAADSLCRVEMAGCDRRKMTAWHARKYGRR